MSTPATPLFKTGSGVSLPIQQPDGQSYVLGYKWKWTQTLKGDWNTIVANVGYGFYFRGTISDGWIIDETRIRKQKGGVGIVEIDWESISGGHFPDEWQVQRDNLQPHIERHPIFYDLSPSDIATVQQAYSAYTSTFQATALNQFAGTTNPTLCDKLYAKLRNGFESYYLCGSRYTWSTYFLPGEAPDPVPGGYTESSPGGPYGAVIPPDTQWLREADEIGQAGYSPLGGIVKLTRNWIGGPSGWWDPDIYPSGD